MHHFVACAKDGAGSATLSMAYAAAEFTNSCLGLERRIRSCGVCLCCFSDAMFNFPFELPLFATKVCLGCAGAEEVYQLGPLNDYERIGLQKAIKELAPSIQKEIDFIRK